MLLENKSKMNQQLRDTTHRHKTISSMANQMMFFMLCDRWFCPNDKLTGLYSLLFYNVMSYLFGYAHQLLSLHDYSPIVHVSEHTNIRHLAMTATKIVLDLTKVITFIITGVFMMLVFGLEQGLEYFNPTWGYIFVTFFYFMLTEYACQENMPAILTWFEFEALENLEILWTPIIIHLCTSFASVVMITLVWLLTDGGWFLIIGASYINVLLGLHHMDHHWKILIRERACLDKYRFATKNELSAQNDVCAVCLQNMTFARVTPCKHMFHGDCLRQCLKGSSVCPLCKQLL